MAFRVLVRESVDDVFIRIKAKSDKVEILGVARIVAAEDRVSDTVCDLNKTRTPRVHEKRRAGEIIKGAPLRAIFSELTVRFPRGCLPRRLVESHHPALWFSRSFPVAQEEVKAFAQILERHLNRVPPRVVAPRNRTCE